MVLVLGDVHGDESANRDALARAYDEADCDVAVQVGDLLQYSVPAPTWFIAGNNEDFDVIEAMRTGEPPPESVENVHLLASDAAEICGLRVAGLSGNYAPTRYEKDRADLTGDRRRHFTQGDVERAKSLNDVDVLLTHEAPHGLIQVGGYDAGCTAIDELVRAIRPDLCLVGHHHRHAESRFGDAKVVSLSPVWEGYYRLDPDSLALSFTSWTDRALSSF